MYSKDLTNMKATILFDSHKKPTIAFNWWKMTSQFIFGIFIMKVEKINIQRNEQKAITTINYYLHENDGRSSDKL